MSAPVRKAHLSEIPSPVEREPGSYDWKPVRHHFGIRSFGINANLAPEAGDWVVEEHTEIEESGTRHEELYYVARGHATFTVGGETADAPEGTFVHVPDPATPRSARAVAPGTVVLAVGGEPGAAFVVSAWEMKYFGEDH
jgi:quercetin dioxygenase-like cupin family protein